MTFQLIICSWCSWKPTPANYKRNCQRWPHLIVPTTGRLTSRPADRFINSPPLLWICQFFPREEGLIHHRSGAPIGFVNWFWFRGRFVNRPFFGMMWGGLLTLVPCSQDCNSGTDCEQNRKPLGMILNKPLSRFDPSSELWSFFGDNSQAFVQDVCPEGSGFSL